jgi:16S rRNA (cytosine1402-N4)-methyltransferase
MQHTPVLLKEMVAAIATDRNGSYVDATYGRGGHSRGLLERLSSSACLLAIDRDEDAVVDARSLKASDSRVIFRHESFSNIAELVHRSGLAPITGIMMDIGVSSPQLDDADRGFSFMRDGPLDMRMDRKSGVTAAEWLNTTDVEELAEIFRRYGEERYARLIARAIVSRRPIQRTMELVAIIADTVPRQDVEKRSATRVFQAVRIYINDELSELDAALDGAFDCLEVGGRLGVITFHSLEHRMVRRRFRTWVRGEERPRRLPVQGRDFNTAKLVVRGARPSPAELAANPRARSAMLQVVERCV